MKTMIKNSSTIFFTNKRKETLDYYKKLGFRTDNDFGFVERDGLEMIFHDTRNVTKLSNYPSNGESALDIYCMVSDAESLYNEFAAKGAEIHKSLSNTEYNMKEFAIIDPSGFTIAFGESLIN